jgi:hypothetical protein
LFAWFWFFVLKFYGPLINLVSMSLTVLHGRHALQAAVPPAASAALALEVHVLRPPKLSKP